MLGALDYLIWLAACAPAHPDRGERPTKPSGPRPSRFWWTQPPAKPEPKVLLPERVVPRRKGKRVDPATELASLKARRRAARAMAVTSHR